MIIDTKFSIFLMGPTACQKTLLAMRLSRFLPIEIISVDSRLIYRGMNIGTAKPSQSELLEFPHRLINIKDPTETYSVASFFSDVKKEVEYIFNKGKIPVFVGGTMLYYKVLLNGLNKIPRINLNLRKSILNVLKNKGINNAHSFLKKKNPRVADRIHPNDSYRILRAIEVVVLSRNNSVKLKVEKRKRFIQNVCQFAILPKNKETLLSNVRLRLISMLDLGFENEVRKLLSRKDVHVNLPSMRCVGYRQMCDYIENKIDYDQLINQIVHATMHLAKRQMTWIRSWKSLYYLDSNNLNFSINTILSILHKKKYI